jgi:hypothetical protein
MIPQFALCLIAGLSLTWCLAPRRQITSGFFRIQNLLTLGLSVLLILTAPQLGAVALGETWLSLTTLRVLAGVAAFLSFFASVLWTLERRQGGTICAFLLCGLSALMLVGLTPSQGSVDVPSAAGSLLSAGWLIGGSVAAMLLGHWYLTAKGMPLAPLIRLNWLFLAAILTRAVFSGLLMAKWPTIDWSAHRVWLLMRWGAGLLGPLVMAVLVFRILRYRNTQSATGVLFAAVILVFMGEMAAVLLSRDLHSPV